MITDPREYALKALEGAKQDLRRDRYLLPIAFIFTDSEILDFNLNFDDAEHKALVYSKLVEAAKERGARAIITLNDATETYPTSEGNLKRDCIYVTVSGPQLTTWSLSLPYTKAGNEIHFGEPTETSNDFLNLLRGWPTKTPNVE
jgi:hypothetical protein